MMTSANAKREGQPSFSPLCIAYLQKWIPSEQLLAI
jgi:hypothetical protein